MRAAPDNTNASSAANDELAALLAEEAAATWLPVIDRGPGRAQPLAELGDTADLPRTSLPPKPVRERGRRNRPLAVAQPEPLKPSQPGPRLAIVEPEADLEDHDATAPATRRRTLLVTAAAAAFGVSMLVTAVAVHGPTATAPAPQISQRGSILSPSLATALTDAGERVKADAIQAARAQARRRAAAHRAAVRRANARRAASRRRHSHSIAVTHVVAPAAAPVVAAPSARVAPVAPRTSRPATTHPAAPVCDLGPC